jgi:hypothetical protein
MNWIALTCEFFEEKSKTWTCSGKSFSEIKFLLLRRMKEKSVKMSEVWMRKEKESWELRRRELGKTWWSWKNPRIGEKLSEVAVAGTWSRGCSDAKLKNGECEITLIQLLFWHSEVLNKEMKIGLRLGLGLGRDENEGEFLIASHHTSRPPY